MRQIAGFHWQLAADANYPDCVVDRTNIYEADGSRRGLNNLEYLGVGIRHLDGVFVSSDPRIPCSLAHLGQALQRFSFSACVSVQNEDDYLPVRPLLSFGAKDLGQLGRRNVADLVVSVNDNRHMVG